MASGNRARSPHFSSQKQAANFTPICREKQTYPQVREQKYCGMAGVELIRKKSGPRCGDAGALLQKPNKNKIMLSSAGLTGSLFGLFARSVGVAALDKSTRPIVVVAGVPFLLVEIRVPS
jgi:hypothetical protein